MTVVYQQGNETIKASAVIYADKAAIRALVKHALMSMTEARIDKLVDCQESCASRADIQHSMKYVKESTEDFLREAMSDLQEAVFKEFEAAQFGAIVTGMKFDLAGDVKDIEVDISVNWE